MSLTCSNVDNEKHNECRAGIYVKYLKAFIKIEEISACSQSTLHNIGVEFRTYYILTHFQKYHIRSYLDLYKTIRSIYLFPL